MAANYFSHSLSGTASRSGQASTPLYGSDNRALYVQAWPSMINVASSCDDNADICTRICPFLSSGPSRVQMPTCFNNNGPENSLLHQCLVSLTVAVSSHSPSAPA